MCSGTRAKQGSAKGGMVTDCRGFQPCFESVEQFTSFTSELQGMLMACPAEIFITLTHQDEVYDVGIWERNLKRWTYKKKKEFKSDIAVAGALTGKGRPHFHGFLWGHNNKGIPLLHNPRFSIARIKEKNFRFWQGYIDARDFEKITKAKSAKYIACSNGNTGLYDFIFVDTTKRNRLLRGAWK